MNSEFLPPDIQAFIDENIGSVEELEVLLLFHYCPGRDWTALDVSRELCTTIDSARTRLEHWAAKALILAKTPETFSLAPQDPDVGLLLGSLAAIYKQKRVTVISHIYNKPASPVRAFSKAFRIRKENQENG